MNVARNLPSDKLRWAREGGLTREAGGVPAQRITPPWIDVPTQATADFWRSRLYTHYPLLVRRSI